jgi:hypothetical protein
MSFLNTCRIVGKNAIPYLVRPLLDAVTNRRYAKADERVLIVRHRTITTRYYAHFLRWIAREFPDLRRRIELTTLPCRIRDWSPYGAMTTWLSEVTLARREGIRRQVLEVERRCQEHNIAVINPVAGVLNATKADCARILRSIGIRTPQTELIEDVDRFKKDLAGLKPPILVRSNLGHGGKLPMYLIESADDVHRFPIEKLRNPIAAEFIDTRSPQDGFYRKYRYHMSGSIGVSSTKPISRHWEVRGRHRVITEANVAEERRYTSAPDPNHELFQEAAKALGLQMLAFDYSYDRDGRVVVWEVNTLPGLRDRVRRGEVNVTLCHDSARATVLRHYIKTAGFDVPERLDEMIRTKGVAGL